MTHEHFHCFVDMLLARPAVDHSHLVDPHAYVPSIMHMGDCAVCGHLQGDPIHSPMSGAIEGSVAEVRRLQDVNAELLDLARNVAGLDAHYLPEGKIISEAVREWQEQARAAIAKAEGKS